MCKWYCTSEGPNTNLKCLNCGCRYCSACLHGEAGQMKSMTKCAKCGKKPTVQGNMDRGAWKDVVNRPLDMEPGGGVFGTDSHFTNTLRIGGSADDNRTAQNRAGSARPASKSPRGDSNFAPQRSSSTSRSGAGGYPATKSQRPGADSVFSRLTDTSKFTGAHQHRFDADGRGRGASGRDQIKKGGGHVPPSGVIRDDRAQQLCPPERDCGEKRLDVETIMSPSRSPRPDSNSMPSSASAAPEARSGGSTSAASVDAAFRTYCGTKPDMDGKTFQKICKDCNLIDRKFTSPDADLVFSKVVVKGQRRIGLPEFLRALKLVAQKKGVDADIVSDLISASDGPVLTGQRAEAVRFHDDKSTYTGVHVNGGPEFIKGYGTSSQLAGAGMRHAQ